MNSNRRWKVAGLIYFSIVFMLVPTLAFAYIDPSVTTYAIQAIAGVAVAAGAFFATYGRRFRKKWRESIGAETDGRKEREPDLEVYQEELKKELAERRAKAREQEKGAETKKPRGRGRILTSVLCGLGFAMTVVLRPILSFYLSNEGEFWFKLADVIWAVLVIFGGVAALLAVIHFLLPGKGQRNIRVLFAVLLCAAALCVYIQNHFMSSYLPVLTGDRIDWSLYAGWNTGSLVLWIGMFALLLAAFAARPQLTKSVTYGLFALLLIIEAVTCGVELATAKHDNVKAEGYFTNEGIYETSEAGNVVVLISDTFEGTYMNEILERWPEYGEMLSDCTYYDNVTGVSVFTYYSYAKLMTGQDFPVGEGDQTGISESFDRQTLIDKVRRNGYDLYYYTEFSPTPSVADKLANYSDGELKPDAYWAWAIAKKLWKSTLFQSAPQPAKPLFLVYTSEYEEIKGMNSVGKEEKVPFVENDPRFYWDLISDGLTPVSGTRPRYTLMQLKGIHHPVDIDTEFNEASYGDDVSIHDQKLIAAKASLNLMRVYLDSLKEAGTYDRTTVIMTADHGFNMRFYPMMLVKEAGSAQDSFRIDSAPISFQEDFEDIVSKLTAGEKFSDIIASMNLTDGRVRTALDFRSVDGSYSARTTRKSTVRIQGKAGEESSYHTERDEFLLSEELSGNYQIGDKLISGGSPSNDAAEVYGLYGGGKIYGHSAVLDVGFGSGETRALNLRATLSNVTDVDQKVVFRLDGEEVSSVVIPAGSETETVVELPEKTGNRWTLELDAPEAQLIIKEEGTLSWNEYDSIAIEEAALENR